MLKLTPGFRLMYPEVVRELESNGRAVRNLETACKVARTALDEANDRANSLQAELVLYQRLSAEQHGNTTSSKRHDLLALTGIALQVVFVLELAWLLLR